MTVRKIVRLGDPVLRTPASAVEKGRLAPPPEGDPELQTLIDEMLETMVSAHGIGLAAPQVGKGIQLFVYAVGDAGGEERPGSQVLVNPIVEPEVGEVVYDWEGCLSMPGLRGLVPRYPQVRVRGLDRKGGELDFIAEDLEARVIQHEYDHLNGVIFLDRMRDLRSLAFEEEWQRFLLREERPGPQGEE